MFWELVLLLPRAQNHKVFNVSEHRNSRFGRMAQTKCQESSQETHRGHGVFTGHIGALCGILRSVHGLVHNCGPTPALIVCAWYLDHDGATRFALEMRSY